MATVQDIEIPDSAARAAAIEETQDIQGEKMVLNMGPSHPATHGVLRIVLELDGEVITKADPDVGYLHRGDEKIAENMTYTQFIPYTDRLDYLAPLANNVAYALAVEKLLGIHDKLPPRCQYIRVMCAELARISSHLLGLGAASGARLTNSYTRIGGLMRDVPPNWVDMIRVFLKEFAVALDEANTLLTRNRIWVDRLRDLGVVSKEMAIDYALSGPNLRGSGVEFDLRKNQPYLCYKDLDFDIAVGSTGDCYDRYLVRMEEMKQSMRILEQCCNKIPGGAENKSQEPVSVQDGKITLPSKQKVLTSMEELIHQFMLVTEGINCPPGETYFGHENPKGELGFYINSKGGGTPNRLKIRAPSFINLSILGELLPGCMISDVPVVLGSLDFVMGESDR